MKEFAIITDSGCDMPEEWLKEKGIECVKLGFTMNNVNYEGSCGESIDVKEFYDKLREGAMPTTYQVTSEMAKQAIEPYLKKGQDVLVIAFSSALSGTADSFKVAEKELSRQYPKRKVVVVDSLCASMGQGLLLWYAEQRAEEGASLGQTQKYIEGLKKHICHHFTVDNLFHLKRGGRVSTATALVGTILKIKPVMHVNDEGKLVAIGKAMGRKKSLHMIVENMFQTMDLEDGDPVFISHGDCMEDVEYVKSLILARLPNVKIHVNYVGTVIGTHSGAGTVALFHKGKHR
ncbi:MAG: DegV family protein [Clostridia bacterium]|nr:DegV family protein [Clostridia bacterium]